MHDWMRDVVYGGRLLRRSPAFTIVAVLSLALGIGVNTAMLALGRSILYQPLPVDRPEQLVVLNWMRADAGRNPMQMGASGGRDAATGRNLQSNFSFPMYQALRAAVQHDADVFAFAMLRQVNVTVGDHAVTAAGMLVSGSYFGGIGARVHLGRGLDAGDERSDAEAAVVLGYRFWQRTFGSDPAVVGTTLRINGHPFTIVGVTGPGFFGVSNGGFFPPTDITVTLGAYPAVQPRWEEQYGSMFAARGLNWLRLMARLRSPDAETRVNQALTLALAQEFSSSGVATLEAARSPEIRLLPGARGLDSLRANMAQPIHILTAVAGIVLLIACVNVAGLLMARGARRRQEFWLRLALGARRAHLVRQTAIESLLLATAGGALGIVVGVWTARALVPLLAGSGPTAVDINVDLRWR
jgi:predicted permease